MIFPSNFLQVLVNKSSLICDVSKVLFTSVSLSYEGVVPPKVISPV